MTSLGTGAKGVKGGKPKKGKKRKRGGDEDDDGDDNNEGGEGYGGGVDGRPKTGRERVRQLYVPAPRAHPRRSRPFW